MNRRKGPEIEKEKREGNVMGGGGTGSHGPAAQRTAEAHHSANYDQASPCRHGNAGNGKSLFSHTPMEVMGARLRADEMPVHERPHARLADAHVRARSQPPVSLQFSPPPFIWSH